MGFILSIKKTGCSGLAYLPDIVDQVNDTDIHFVTVCEIAGIMLQQTQKNVSGLVIDYQLIKQG